MGTAIYYNKVLSIFVLLFFICFGSIADDLNTKQYEDFDNNILALPANFGSTSDYSTGTLEATIIRAKSENYSGLAIPVSLSTLIASPGSKKHQISKLHDLMERVRSRYLMPYLVLDCRINPKLFNNENLRFKSIFDGAKKSFIPNEHLTLEWGDGLSSPVMAYNELTDNEGIFVFDWKYGNRLWSLNNYSYLTDGNRKSRMSRWISKSGESSVEMELSFTKPYNIERVEIFFEDCYPTSAFDIQLRVTEHPQMRGEWQECYKIDNNSSSHPVIKFDKPYFATSIRIQFYLENDNEVVRLHEVEIYMRNTMGKLINLARDAVFQQKVSNFRPPEHVMLIVNNDKSVALIKNDSLRDAGAMLLPWRWVAVFVGERYVELAKSIEMEIPVSFSMKNKEYSGSDIPALCATHPFPVSVAKARDLLAEEISNLAKKLKPEGILITHLETDCKWMLENNSNSNIRKSILQSAKNYQNSLELIKSKLSTVQNEKFDIRLGLLLNYPLGYSKFEGRNWAKPNFIPEGAPSWFDESFATYGVGDIVDFISVNSKNTHRGLYLEELYDNGCLSDKFMKLDLKTMRSLVDEQTQIYNFSWSE